MNDVRQRFSMDKDWLFHLGEVDVPANKSHNSIYGRAKAGGAIGPAGMEWNDSTWQTVQLPHDWSYQQPFDRENGVPNFGFKPRGIGWYRKKFRLPAEDLGKQLTLGFDGIATEASIYLNGSLLERNFSAYTSFTVDISDRAYYGDRPNVLAIRVDATEAEGWWYEGAGIYRHVWLTTKLPLHMAERGVWVRPEKINDTLWQTHIETVVGNELEHDVHYTLTTYIQNAKNDVIQKARTESKCAAGSKNTVVQKLNVINPAIWDIDTPNLYQVHSVLTVEGKLYDTTVTSFGYRTIRICPDEGFFLNEQPLKLKGTCNHQDHAGVGVALPDGLQEYRIRRLKEMGSNAYRAAHHNPTPELLDICDRLGMLVMDENRNFETSGEGLRQLENMVTRDRNHPCVVFYSLFNEEPHQGTPIGRRMVKRMMRTVKRLDPTRPVLGALNGGVMEDDGTADILEITGFNYMHASYDKFKAKHPAQPIIGSETVSAFSTRGNYLGDSIKQVFDSYDQEKAPWGATVREAWQAVATRDFVMGTFVWTGFDYRGEPTPYEWPSINTHFGIMDTCGFPKDAYYLYQAYWLDEPILHMLPHWNWQGREGQPIKVMTHTNCEEVSLYVNGQFISREHVDLYKQLEWEVPYEPGIVRMEGYNNGQLVNVTEVATTGETASLRLELQKPYLYGDGKDAIAVNLYAIDAQQRFVPTDSRFVTFTLSGSGKILGVGNGNPNCHEADAAQARSLFAGCCQLIVQSVPGSDPIVLRAEAAGLAPMTWVIPVKETAESPYIPSVKETYVNDWHVTQEPYRERPDPLMIMDPTDMNTWEKVDVSYGALNMLKGISGYVVFRSQLRLSEQERSSSATLLFNEIEGDVEIYADMELLLVASLVEPTTLEIPLREVDLNGKNAITLSVLVHMTKQMSKPGISGSVCLLT
ncbi:beta-galactosidase GalA [Paenibacillus sp. P36]|uniref:beta-galactosidase GalA n=1 Tax=Paenibacillus sp. P36 TaxID=3342538 RepID=UPI0038B31FB6